MSLVKDFLKYINSIPFGVTIKHYQNFGGSSLKDNQLLSVESWDKLRESHPHFSVSDNRGEWLKAVHLEVVKDGQDKGLVKRAEDVVSLLRNKKIKKIFSVGVGGAGLEYNIKKISPDIKVYCSEYSEKNINTLKKVFVEADGFEVFDILKGDWKNIKEKYLNDKNSALLMYRLDAGFSNEQWRVIFESVYDAGLDSIIYIPTTLLTLLSIWNRKKREMIWSLKKKPVSFAGYLRTKKGFKNFWLTLYKDQYFISGGLGGFFLERGSGKRR